MLLLSRWSDCVAHEHTSLNNYYYYFKVPSRYAIIENRTICSNTGPQYWQPLGLLQHSQPSAVAVSLTCCMSAEPVVESSKQCLWSMQPATYLEPNSPENHDPELQKRKEPKKPFLFMLWGGSGRAASRRNYTSETASRLGHLFPDEI